MAALEDRGERLNVYPDEWEVCFFSDAADYQVSLKCFSSWRRARRFMIKTLRKSEAFYCATISNERRSAFKVFYWNGRQLIDWDKSWVLSRRQVLGLDFDSNGQPVLNGPDWKWTF